MSLSLVHSAGYINNIENGINFPSMTVFFYIREYFDVTPMEFFDIDTKDPPKINELIQAASQLNGNKFEHLSAIAKALK